MLLLVMMLTTMTAWATDVTLSGDESYTAHDGDVLTGSTSGTVTIADGASITLNGVTINGGIVCEGTAEITLVGTNSVRGAFQKAGIQIGGSGSTLTIKGDGSLTANGGAMSAGIGLSRAWEVDTTGGDIVIEGGNITANGNSWGAGIGTGVAYHANVSLGNINIKSGTVKATGGLDANGIGTGHCYATKASNSIGAVTVYGEIDMVDASSISKAVTYMHGDTDVTDDPSEYFDITEDGNRRVIEGKHYTITYTDAVDGENGVTNTNPTTYTFNTPTFSLVDPIKSGGFTFMGWFNDAAHNTPATTTIAKGTRGKKTFYAAWTGEFADGTAYYQPADLDVISATYVKTLGEERVGKHQAWLVPFDYTITAADLEKFTFYKINMIANSPDPSVEATDEMWVFLTRLDAGDVLHGNMPYVYKPKEAVTDYDFTSIDVTLKGKNTGVIAKTETLEDIYSFYATYDNTMATAGDPFYYVTINGGITLGNDGTVTVGPYRWIIRKTSKFGGTPAYAREMHFFDGEDGNVTGIENMADEAVRTPAAVYTLDGRRVAADFDKQKSLQPGVYIVGGRKVVIK